MIIEDFKFTTIKIDPKWKIIGIQMSGGLDSTLLAYLYAFTIKKHNLAVKLKRLTFNFENKPNTLPTARLVENTIKEILNYDCWTEPYEKTYTHKREHSTKKILVELYTTNMVDHFAHGRTKNPPLTELVDYNNSRVLERDSPIPEGYDEISEPFYNITKDVLVKAYFDYGLVKNLMDLTQSCDVDMPAENIPCNTCWWCNERAWAINKVLNYEYTSEK